MAAPSAVGAHRETLEGLRQLVADSTTFQALVGAVDGTAALAIVRRDTIDESGSEVELPRVRCFLPEYRRRSIAHGSWPSSGTGEIVIEVAPSASYPSDADAEAWFSNQLGSIIDEMTELVTSGPYLIVSGFSTEKPSRNAKGEAAFWRCVIRAEFGVGGGAS